MPIRRRQTILFIGDSITDCGRRLESAPLGNGYVKLFADMHLVRNPGKEITVINKGISGDTVAGLNNRWHDDVIRNRPDWVSIKIGINDLHRNFDESAESFSMDPFLKSYTEIMERTRSALPSCKMLLIDPFFISTDRSPESFRSLILKRLPAYCRVVKDLSREYGTLHVKTHAMFQRLLKVHEPDVFCPEPVHPNLTGHFAIAEAVYATLQRG